MYAFGYSAGAGIDIAVWANLFVRGVFEWIQFANLPETNAQFVTGWLPPSGS